MAGIGVVSAAAIRRAGGNRERERQREAEQEVRIGLDEVERHRARRLVGDDPLREVARLGVGMHSVPTIARVVDGAVAPEPEDPLERASEVPRTDELAVGVPDARPQLERVRPPAVGRLRDRPREIGDERRAVEPSDALEAHEAVVRQGQDAPRPGEVREGGVDRVQHVARHDGKRPAR